MYLGLNEAKQRVLYTFPVLVDVSFLNKDLCCGRATLDIKSVSHGSSKLLYVIEIHLTPPAAHLDYFVALPHIYHKLEDYKQVRFLDLVTARTSEQYGIQIVFPGRLESPNVFSHISRVKRRALH